MANATQGIFAGLSSWVQSQAAQYTIQTAYAARGRASADIMRAHDAAFSEIDRRGMGVYDTLLAKYACRQMEQQTDTPEKAELREANIKMIKATMNLSLDDADRIRREPAGWGPGAFLGRLVGGRVSEAAREAGEANFKRFYNETGFVGKDVSDLNGVKAHETDIRAGRLSPEDVLGKEWAYESGLVKPGQGLDANTPAHSPEHMNFSELMREDGIRSASATARELDAPENTMEKDGPSL